MHSRRSVLNTLLITSALVFAPSLASAQDTTGAGGSTAQQGTVGGTATAGTGTKTKKDAKKKGKKKDKKSTSEGGDDPETSATGTPARVETKVDEGTPDADSGNPSVVIAPGPTASGPGVVDTGSGGGTTDVGGDPGGGDTGGGDTGGGGGPPVVPPPPVSPMM